MTGTKPAVEHLDVLIVGAGISGIGAAYYLQRDHPQRTVALLEARGATGGTWDLFRYPGIRSDSDLYTFGYEFKPWRDEESIAGADRILAYLRETAAEHGIDDKVRFHHEVRSISWSGTDARWTVEIERTDTGGTTTLTCSWVFCAGGYFRYDEGFTPVFPGRERFAGPIVHPQAWPEDLDTAGKRVLVIGSGATAVTLVPALTAGGAQVTMLQRTPSYVLPVPGEDKLALRLRKLLGDERAHPLIRRKNIAKGRFIYQFCQRHPERARKLIRWVNAKQLPEGYPVDEHFKPPYDPWDQRLCAVPDGDLFRAIREGTAEVVTDRIATFTETGVALESGRELTADVIITATGLNVQAFGGITIRVDGAEVHPADTVAYKGVMLSGVPNLAFSIGYTNSSWTLKVGLVCTYLTRLLSRMDDGGCTVARPEPRDPGMPTRPYLDFAAGYITRAVDQLPRQGDRAPWTTSMDYRTDVALLREGDVADPELHLSRAGAPAAVSA